MRASAKLSALLAGLVLGGLQLLAPVGTALGQQSNDPSQLLQSVGGDQAQSLLNRLTGQGSNDNGPDMQNPQDRQRGTGTEQPERRRPRESLEQRRAEQEQDEELNTLFPVYHGEDWVVVEVDYFLPPRPISLQTLASLGALSSAASLQALSAGPTSALAGLAASSAASQSSTQAATAALAPGANVVAGAGYAPGAANGGNGPTYSIGGRKLSDEDKQKLQELMDLIRSKNPYQLTRDGSLILPGFAPIPLLGLTDDSATLRLRVEPALHDLDVRVTRLPVRKSGFEGLKPFGYDLFWGMTSTFAPTMGVPVPSDYVVGPGDQLQVQLYGNTNRSFNLTVGRDGRINMPQLGPVNVAGQLFTSVKANLEARVEHEMIGVRAGISMRDTRSITVFVMGDVNTAGSYTISGLSTVTTALFVAGGIKPIGSMRRIELRRSGRLIGTFDMYDLLLHGNNTGDQRLQQDDVVFVPPVGPTVAVEGQVRRPAIYEVREASTVRDAIELAGGLTPEADESAAELTRIDAAQQRVVLPVNLRLDESRNQQVRNGDRLRVDPLHPMLDSAVTLQGHVYTTGAFAFRPGMRLTDVIRSVDQLKAGADLHYVLVRRESPPDRRVSVVSADLGAALAAPGSAADVELKARDRVTVFDLTTGRDRIIQPLLDELRAQSSADRPTPVVHVEGKVRVPGEYPLEPGMKIADLIRAGGGLTDEAYSGRAELARHQVVDGDNRRTEISTIALTQVLHNDPAGNLTLEPFDDLSIKEVTAWGDHGTVTLSGEVRFPGEYPIRPGETLRSVLARAGGLSQYAFPEGSVFTREELKHREQEQIDLLVTRTQTDLTAQALQPTGALQQVGAAAAFSMGQSLLAQLRAAKPVGRLVIDLPLALREPPGSTADVILRDHDRLFVPRFQQQVTVIGEVQNSTSHLFKPGLSRDDYIRMSGGITRMADGGRIYVVRANGSVVARGGTRWFDRSAAGVKIKPGDTIVVPLDTEHLPSLPFWQAVTGILYNLAISVAAIHYL